MMQTPAWYRRRASELGESVSELVEVLLEVNALYRLRSVQGVIRRADKYGIERLDKACNKALVAGDPVLKTVRGILVAGTEDELTEPNTSPPSARAHLHGPVELFNPVAPEELS